MCAWSVLWKKSRAGARSFQSLTAALEFTAKEDHGRKRYLKEHFGKDIDDPLLYHLIINTDQVPQEHAAVLIGDAVIERFQLGGRSPVPR